MCSIVKHYLAINMPFVRSLRYVKDLLENHMPFLIEYGYILLLIAGILLGAYVTLRLFKIVESKNNYTEAEEALRKLKRKRKSSHSDDDSDSDPMDGREAKRSDPNNHLSHDHGSNTLQVSVLNFLVNHERLRSFM